MRRGLSVLQRFNGRRSLAWVALRAAAQHPKALDLGVDDPSGWLKELALENIPNIFVTLDTFHLLSGWLKELAP